MDIKDGREVDAGHENVVPHVVLALQGLCRAQISRHRDVG